MQQKIIDNPNRYTWEQYCTTQVVPLQFLFEINITFEVYNLNNPDPILEDAPTSEPTSFTITPNSMMPTTSCCIAQSHCAHSSNGKLHAHPLAASNHELNLGFFIVQNELIKGMYKVYQRDTRNWWWSIRSYLVVDPKLGS